MEMVESVAAVRDEVTGVPETEKILINCDSVSAFLYMWYMYFSEKLCS